MEGPASLSLESKPAKTGTRGQASLRETPCTLEVNERVPGEGVEMDVGGTACAKASEQDR